MKVHHLLLLATCAFTGGVADAFAGPTPPALLPAVFSTQYKTDYWDGTQIVETFIPSDSDPSGSIGGSGVTSAFSSFSGVLAPIPTMTASSSATSSDPVHSAQAFANASINYYFYVAGPDPVPLHVFAQGSGVLTTQNSSSYARQSFKLFDKSTLATVIQNQSPSNWTVDQTVSVTPYDLYEVIMTADTNALALSDGTSTDSESATSTVDPVFTIDVPPDLAAQYQIFFSDGVGNGPAVTSVPMPSTLSLFAVGVAAIRWRRSRAKAASTPGWL